ncbi:homing endonuclease protein [Leptolyngbya phage Lbo-JY46]
MEKEQIRKLYSEGYSISKLAKINKCGKQVIERIIGDLKRTPSEARKLYLKQNKILHTEKTKEKIRQHRLKWIKENPEKTAWRKANESYIEKLVKEYFIKNKWDNSHLIIQEKSIFPYFIDFAFENEKVALELDGSQHEKQDRKLKDKEKDDNLLELGWRIYRIPALNILKNLENEMIKFSKFIKNNSSKIEKVGLFKYTPKHKIKNPRIYRGGINRTEKEIQSSYKQRKVKNRPSLYDLENDVKKLGYSGTGRKYNVSDNCIRKWIKQYKLGNAM